MTAPTIVRRDFEAQPQPPIPVAEVIRRIWLHWKLLGGAVFVVGLIAAGISLVIPNDYTAAVTLLPEGKSSGSLSGLTQLAATFGVNVGGAGQNGMTELYPTILTSEKLLGPLLHRRLPTAGKGPSTIMQQWKYHGDSLKDYQEALRRFRSKAVAVDLDRKTLVTTLSVTLRDPVTAASVANLIAAQLDTFARKFQRTQANQRVEWVETRLGQVSSELTVSEIALRDFRIRNRTFLAPQLQLEEQRLSRQVETNSSIYLELKRQLEVAKIEQVKDIPVVQILDVATPPVKKSAPKRTVIVLGAMLLAALIGGVLAVKAPQILEWRRSRAAKG